MHKVWQADNDNARRGPYPPLIRGNLAFKYDTVEAEAAQSCPIRFQGQWEDAETGLYYNRFRYYDPLAAQYISPDPIGLAGGLRPNAYVHNPNAWVAPWGLSCCSIKGRIKSAGLPTKGKIRFIPGKDYNPTVPLRRGPNNGYIDQFYNEWVKGPPRTAGQAFEWDVQLSRIGKSQLGWASRDGSHLNVSLDGRITHK